MDDGFPDASYHLATFQVVQVFTFVGSHGVANPQAKMAEAYSAVAAWGVMDALNAAMVHLLLNVTNRVFHHYIVNDQELETAFEKGNHKAEGATEVHAGVDKNDKTRQYAEAIIKFSLEFPRKATKNCFEGFRLETVEANESIILAEAFAYSTRGFQSEANEQKHDKAKKDLFIEIIEKMAEEGEHDPRHFIHESIDGLAAFRKCIILEAKALNDGLYGTLNLIKKDAFADKEPKDMTAAEDAISPKLEDVKVPGKPWVAAGVKA